MTNLRNPKSGVFYLAVIPGLFAPGDVTIWRGALLGTAHGAIGLIFLTAVAIFAAHIRRFLTRPTVNAAVELACGLCLLAFAVLVATETVATLLD